MMFEVLIGDTINRGRAANRLIEFERCGWISHNDSAYWCVDIFCKMSMCIMKDTVVGKLLAKMIEKIDVSNLENMEKRDTEHIRKWLVGVFLRHVDVAAIEEKIEAALKNSYHSGRRAMQKEIQEVLGIQW